MQDKNVYLHYSGDVDGALKKKRSRPELII